MEAALAQAEKVAAYKGLTGKNALHLRLLAEEMMGMMRSITGETEGKFWIEDESGEFRLHLPQCKSIGGFRQQSCLQKSGGMKLADRTPLFESRFESLYHKRDRWLLCLLPSHRSIYKIA